MRIEIEDEEQSQTIRDKVNGLEDYALELREKVTALKAKNDLKEIDEVYCKREVENTKMLECIELMAQIMGQRQQIAKAEESLAENATIEEMMQDSTHVPSKKDKNGEKPVLWTDEDRN